MNPKISVVIPLWNKKYEIPLVLTALDKQDIPHDLFEIVIVDDGSEDRIDDIIDRFRKTLNINYSYIPRSGNRAYNRNYGVSISKGERILLLDSDMIASQNTLREFLLSTDQNKNRVVMGTRDCIINFDKSMIDETIVRDHFELIQSLPAMHDERTLGINYSKRTGLTYNGGWQYLFSHCVCFWKDLFVAVNGFDEEFGKNWGAEDVELGYRFHLKGAEFIINEKVKCYHIYHNVNSSNNFNSMLNNYKLFLSKHQYWEVEIFIREFEAWASNAILLQEQVKKKEHIVKCTINKNKIQQLYSNVAIFGIESDELIESEITKIAYIPESSLSSKKIIPAFGIQTGAKSEQYDYALISGNYRLVNYGLFILILQEAKRIAKNVIIISDGYIECFENYNSKEIEEILSQPKLILQINNEYYFDNNKYYILKIAGALDELGVKVGLQLAYDPHNEVNWNDGYLSIKDSKQLEMYSEFFAHKMAFIGDQIPAIFDINSLNYNFRHFKKRIFWQELKFLNQDKLLKKSVPDFMKMIFRREVDKCITGAENCEVVNVGIDVELVKKYEKYSRQERSTFRFVWTDIMTTEYSNVILLVDLFIEKFGDRSDVELILIFEDNFLPYIKNEYCNEIVSDMFCRLMKNLKGAFDEKLYFVIDKIKDHKNIRLIRKVDEETIVKEVAESDCFIYLNSTTEISPVVLYSIAFGKKPIVPNLGEYSEYVKRELLIEVETYKKNAAFYEGCLESAFIDRRDLSRYNLCFQISKEDLSSAMDAVLEKGYNNITNDDMHQFRQNYSWEKVAQKMINAIWGTN
jgi:glycosyltransferase involved in cell wall biosynthesis